MNLKFKGKYTDVKQLQIGNLPDNAVKFKEPNNPLMLNLIASIFVVPILIIVGIATIIKMKLDPGSNLPELFNIWGLLLAIIMILPHELLHASAFPKNTEVQLWYSLKNFLVFVFSTYPVTKLRFIYLSLLPNIIFGFLPLLIWIFIPSKYAGISEILFSFAFFSLLFGIGDFLNIFNAIFQMPRGSLTQLYGFNSYWYIPKNNKN